MKLNILSILSLTSFAAASGSVELCVNSPKVNLNFECGTITFDDPGCYTLPVADGSYQHPNLHNNTHYIGPSKDLSCLIYDTDGCAGQAFAEVIYDFSPNHYDKAVSSIYCY